MSNVEFKKNRWRFEAEITTKTPLHIGSGESIKKTRPVKDREPVEFEANAVITDYQGRAYLPGRAIKGAMRSWLLHVKDRDETIKGIIEQVFGSEDTKKKGFVGGKAEFQNAFFVHHDRSAAKAPYWDGQRLTGVMAHTAIIRTSKTARDQKLFHEEFVPPGVTFKVILTGQNLGPEEAALLLFALKGFGRDDVPIRLGAGEQDLRGEFTLNPKTIKIQCLDPGGIAKWLRVRDLPSGLKDWNVSGGGYDDLPDAESQKKGLQEAAKNWHVTPPALLRIKLQLAFDPAFMVHDPSRGQKALGDDTLSDHRALLDTNDHALLPADSFRGAFRSQAEKILRTLGIHACDPQGPDPCKAIQDLEKVDPNNGKKVLDTLCPACRIFGAGGWASTLQVSDFMVVAGRSGESKRQDFVAIDRFTGGASPGKKFDAEPYWNPVLEGTIALELDRSKPWALGLLALTLRDLIEGDITFGFGAAKGYGACMAEIVDTAISGTMESLPEWKELKACLGAPSVKKSWGGLDLQPFANEFRTAAKAIGTLPFDRPTEPLESPAPDTAQSLVGGADQAIVLQDQVGGAQQPAPAQSQAGPLPAPLEDDSFYNPYHFVPVADCSNRDGDWNAGDFFKKEKPVIGHVTHDRFTKEAVSGRIECTLKAEDPFIVGASQVPNSDGSKTLVPFTLPNPITKQREPAIPATSLRGLISSIAEAASNGAMRVLSNRPLSVRMTRDEGLPAIGMIRNTSNGRELQPLAFPTNLGWVRGLKRGFLPEGFLRIFKQCSPLAYLNGYEPIRTREPDGRTTTSVQPTTGSFLETQQPLSFSSDYRQKWYAKLPPWTLDDWVPSVFFPEDGERLSQNQQCLIGSQINEVISKEEFEKRSSPQGYTPGILRVLNFEGHETEIPQGKKHEIFIPFSEEQEDITKAVTFPAENALRVFEALAAQRIAEQPEEEAYLPFDLKRRGGPKVWRQKAVKLRDGDLVFFLPKVENGKVIIDQIAISSIWRKDKKAVFAYFEKVSPELLPMSQERKTISLAERLFGFVGEGEREGDKKGEEQQTSVSRALAGRVQFSFGKTSLVEATNCWEYNQFRPLKILASPKPPCPALYFTRDGGSISKCDLKVGDLPQGRKFYLHRKPDALGQKTEPWLADNMATLTNAASMADIFSPPSGSWQPAITGNDPHRKQRLWANPVKKDSVFTFHVDFSNLDKDELALLCYALKPTAAFHHKLGLGKPIGLGKVCITPGEISYVDRAKRYSEDSLDEERYRPPCPSNTAPKLASGAPSTAFCSFEESRREWGSKMDEDILRALELIGNPERITHPVHYPKITNNNDDEKLYEWFMENEKRGEGTHQPLVPLDRNSSELPVLKRLPRT